MLGSWEWLATRFTGSLSLPVFAHMPFDRQLIETDKAVLRRTYANDAPGLALLKAYAATLYESCPSDVEVTTASREGVTGSGQVTNNLRLRRIAVEELIVERDPDYIAPDPVIPRRPLGSVVRVGWGPG